VPNEALIHWVILELKSIRVIIRGRCDTPKCLVIKSISPSAVSLSGVILHSEEEVKWTVGTHTGRQDSRRGQSFCPHFPFIPSDWLTTIRNSADPSFFLNNETERVCHQTVNWTVSFIRISVQFLVRRDLRSLSPLLILITPAHLWAYMKMFVLFWLRGCGDRCWRVAKWVHVRPGGGGHFLLTPSGG